MKPVSEVELGAAIKDAGGPVAIRGGGTRGVPLTGEVLETGGLTGITLYEPGALTLVVRAGTPLHEVEAALEAEGQRLAFEPMDHRALMGTEGAPTIGGVVAGNISGPRRIQAGACRDSLLGVRFVDGRGTVITNGGRVMKNVTGYDLVKLMCGSWGTLGVLSEVSLKVLPAPEATATVVIAGLEDTEAVKAMSKALGSPYEVSGAAHLPEAGRTLLRIEGFASSVTYRAGQLQALLGSLGDVTIEGDPQMVSETWTAVRDVHALQSFDGDVWRISVKPSDGPRVGAALPGARLVYDWGGGLVWAGVAPGTDVRAALDVVGHATLVRGNGNGPRFHPEPAAVATLSQGLRDQFDPRGILNAGLFN